MEDKELFFKMNMLEQYMKNMHQQIEAVENECLELNSLKKGIEDLKDSSGKETFSSVGKNIFIKTKIISEDLLVGIGEKNLVTKSIPETAKIIENQIKKLELIRGELMMELEKLNKEAEKIINSVENKPK
jgi:prefoldin alpha subunit